MFRPFHTSVPGVHTLVGPNAHMQAVEYIDAAGMDQCRGCIAIGKYAMLVPIHLL